jgi:hypothetical protein
MLTLLLTIALQTATPTLTPDVLWQSWPDERFVEIPAPCLRPDELNTELERLAELYPKKIRLEEIGRSYLDRPIHMLSVGDGKRTVLLWSQMHGDEPSATPALLDIAHFLLSRPEEPEATAILSELRLLMIPMLNPDGSEIYERRNFQAIDINRDALNLATPEGRILRKLRDQYKPILGFNLHDQNRRTAVGNTGVLATNAVLAVAGDAEGTVTPGRLLAKRACSAIVEALAPFMPGGMARYDEDWSPRAFGDNITAWGTPVVLIESGGLPPGRDFEELTRLNFVAILTVLRDLVRNDLQDYDPQVYEELLRNESDAWADVVVRGGYLRQPGSGPAYRADLAFFLSLDDREAAGCGPKYPTGSRIVEIGDARFLGAGRVVDASQSLLLAPFTAGVEGWKARRWLSSDVLSDLARLGVGTVYWKVSLRKIEKATALAREFSRSGHARLVAVPTTSEMPELTLSGPPSPKESDLLADVVRAFSGDSAGTKASSPEIVGLLSWVPNSASRQPTLRRGQPASFVLLTPATEGVIDPESVRLDSVFIDGVEVFGGSH